MKYTLLSITCLVIAVSLDGYIDQLRLSGIKGLFIDGAPNLISGIFIPLAIMSFLKFSKNSYQIGLGFVFGLVIYEFLQGVVLDGVFDLVDLVMTAIAATMLIVGKHVISKTRNSNTL